MNFFLLCWSSQILRRSETVCFHLRFFSRILLNASMSKWMTAVMKEYRKNKKGGLSGAMKRARRKYKKKKK